MCESCGIHLKRNPEELVELINDYRCPSCDQSLVDDDIDNKKGRFAHAVVTALIMSAENLHSLKSSLNRAYRDYNGRILVNSYGKEYSKKQLLDVLNNLDSTDSPEFKNQFFEKPLNQKLQGLIQEELEDNVEQNDGLDIFATTKNEISNKINNSLSNEDENQEVKPTKKVIEDYIGLCDAIFLGTGHTAPILGNLVEQMEKHNVDLILVESGINNNSIDADDGPVSHRAASRYESLHPSTKVRLLRGTPDDFDTIVENASVTGFRKEKGWLEDDHSSFKDKRREQKLLDREYYEAIISERDGKFATEIVGYILENKENLNGNVCVMAGKTHIPGIYQRLTGLSL